MGKLLQDNQFYFFRLKPTGAGNDWRVGHLMIEDGKMQMHSIGYAKPWALTPLDVASNDFVLIERPSDNPFQRMVT